LVRGWLVLSVIMAEGRAGVKMPVEEMLNLAPENGAGKSTPMRNRTTAWRN